MDNTVMRIMQTQGVTMEQAADAFHRAMKLLGPIGELEIMPIKANPSLNTNTTLQIWRVVQR